MSNKTYDVLKFIAMIALPAVGTLYGSLAKIWNLPLGDEIVTSIIAIDTCLGVLLGISSNAYKNKK